jgi:glucokinase
MSTVIGLDVGGTNTSGGLGTPEGKLITRRKRATDRAGGGAAGLRLISEIIAELIEEAGGAVKVQRIGVGFGGPVDAVNGVVVLSHHVAGWENVPLQKELEQRFQIPVAVDNDANAGTLGEWRFGAGRGCDDLLYVNIGTGIGGGIISGGRLLRGARNLAGEIGHTTVVRNGPPCTCGRGGCVESCASGDAIARRGSEALGKPLTGREVFDLAGGGDARARRVLEEIVEDLAQGIGVAVTLLNPELVIIGGGLSEAPQDLFLGPLKKALPRYCLDQSAIGLRVEAAQLRYEAGLMGAIALALTAADSHQRLAVSDRSGANR